MFLYIFHNVLSTLALSSIRGIRCITNRLELAYRVNPPSIELWVLGIVPKSGRKSRWPRLNPHSRQLIVGKPWQLWHFFEQAILSRDSTEPQLTNTRVVIATLYTL